MSSPSSSPSKRLNQEENSGSTSPPQPPHPLFLQSTLGGNPPITYTRRKYRNPNSPRPSFIEEIEHHINGDKRGQNTKFIDQLPQSRGKAKINKKGPGFKGGNSDSDLDDGKVISSKMQKISVVNHRSDDVDSTQQKKAVRGTIPLGQGITFNSAETQTRLPAKNQLFSILDKLQKEDIYEAFSKPVDMTVLTDYNQVIEKPMDFETVRKKLDCGVYYKYMEDFEADVMLIFSNAMSYNRPNSFYHRQARAIKELAKKEFDLLKYGDNQGQLSQSKTPLPSEPSPSGSNAPQHSPTAAPPSGDNERATRSGRYNLRKVTTLPRYRDEDIIVTPRHSRGSEKSSLASGHNWNAEFPESILKGDARQRRIDIVVDSTRRDTYVQDHPMSSIISTNFPQMQLLPVAPSESFDYAKSLLKFAADLGPVAHKVALKKMQPLFPHGVPNNIIESMGETGTTMSQCSSFFQSPEGIEPGVGNDTNQRGLNYMH